MAPTATAGRPSVLHLVATRSRRCLADEAFDRRQSRALSGYRGARPGARSPRMAPERLGLLSIRGDARPSRSFLMTKFSTPTCGQPTALGHDRGEQLVSAMAGHRAVRAELQRGRAHARVDDGISHVNRSHVMNRVQDGQNRRRAAGRLASAGLSPARLPVNIDRSDETSRPRQAVLRPLGIAEYATESGGRTVVVMRGALRNGGASTGSGTTSSDPVPRREPLQRVVVSNIVVLRDHR